MCVSKLVGHVCVLPGIANLSKPSSHVNACLLGLLIFDSPPAASPSNSATPMLGSSVEGGGWGCMPPSDVTMSQQSTRAWCGEETLLPAFLSITPSQYQHLTRPLLLAVKSVVPLECKGHAGCFGTESSSAHHCPLSASTRAGSDRQTRHRATETIPSHYSTTIYRPKGSPHVLTSHSTPPIASRRA